MNLQGFGEGVGTSFIASCLYGLISVAALAAWARLSSKVLLARFSLRTKISIAIVGSAVLALVALKVGASAYITLLILCAVLILAIQTILSELSQVGILNAFSTTERGISASASLKRVNGELWFLGIGAKKLTDSPEFEPALRRCRENGGRLRFLLSSPTNPALEQIAKNNQRDSLSYSLRVTESIREIVNKARSNGVAVEIKLYKLDQELALPHFRLMFINDEVCLFSHLVWNDREGMDNPQLVMRNNVGRFPTSLYRAFRSYYEDLWNSGAASPIDDDPVFNQQ